MIYCLDANTAIFYLKGTHESVRLHLRERKPEHIRIPEIVRAELLFGVARSKRQAENGEKLAAFLRPFSFLPFGGEAVEHYADIRNDLAKRGTPIGPNDLIIAATVRSHGATLVTNNVEEFKRVKGLRVEDWS